MRKIFIIALICGMLSASCTKNHNEVVLNDIKTAKYGVTPEEKAKKVVLEMLNRIDPQTRGGVRKMASVEFISFRQLFGSNTRNESDSIGFFGDSTHHRQPGVIIINFQDSTGFGVGVTNPIEEPEKFEGIEDGDPNIQLLALTDSGSLTSDEIVSYIDSWMNNNSNGGNSGSTSPNLYDSEDDDYLIGGADSDEFVMSLLCSYVYNSAVNGGNITEEDEDDYQTVANMTNAQVGPLLRTKWWQGLPFNYYCHTYNSDGDKRPVGCVTVATAQILTYFKNRPLNYYFGITSSFWGDLENEHYTQYVAPTNQTQFDAATLMKKIADEIGVKYNYCGSGGTFATPKKAQQYLENDLGYSIDRQVGGRGAKRLRNIVSSLNNNKPVFMAALDGVEGHAWVVDGYMQNQESTETVQDYFIHCNFGWGGSNDGWYFINVLSSNSNSDDYLDEGSGEQGMNYTWMFRYLFFE